MIAPGGLARIHEAALSLLGDVGCAVFDPEALALFAAHGAAVDGERVRLGETLIAEAVASAPAGYTVAGRRPERDLQVGNGAAPVFSSASGPAFVLDAGERRHGHLADVRDAVALTHLSANVGVYGLAIAALDVPEENRPQAIALATATGTDKPSRVDVTTPDELRVALDVAEILYGAELARAGRACGR